MQNLIVHGRGAKEEKKRRMVCVKADLELSDETVLTVMVVLRRLVLVMTKVMYCGQCCCWTQTSIVAAAAAVAVVAVAVGAASLEDYCSCSVKSHSRITWRGKAYYWCYCYCYCYCCLCISKGAKSIC